MSLISYKMTHDSGFAPNPFHGYLTLATCKPGIRSSRNRQKGDWIAGFTSKELCGDPVGAERLVYLMQVDEICCLGKYFNDPRFQTKKPIQGSQYCIRRVGDNIYKSNGNAYVQIANDCHGPECQQVDVSGRNVLIAYRGSFFYFGREALVVPEQVRPSIPARSSFRGVETHDGVRRKAFIDYVRGAFDPAVDEYPQGMNGWPRSVCGVAGNGWLPDQ